ncbi:sensor histidine kinase [Natronorubrum halophilum]|uniref:sensor histidine kinase n=1 Tax=Natronorubrum halophilum TaxID=1702106 RepID=UPI0010C2086D|nr:PAS domain-containing sensor histidine kinase [Natronorubrum halophilum]
MGESESVTLPEIFDDLTVGIIVHDPQTGEILDVNDQIEQLYGHSGAVIREMNVEDFTAPSTRFSQNEAVRLIRAAADGDPQTFEWRVERVNGELLWVCANLKRTTIDATPVVIAEIRDITRYKARERRLRLLSRVVRHNLRNETNLLMGYADRIQSAIKEDTFETEIGTILDIAAEIGTLSDSIRQIEEIAEPSATQRHPMNIGDVVREQVEEGRSEYPKADLTVDVRSEVHVNADRALHYAIRHAIENAIVHNDRETPSVTVVITEDANAGQGEIRFIDNGPFIPEIEIDALDDEVPTSSTYHGSGVGLWVMKWCVDSLGGELSFERRSPRGNIVRFLLPQASAAERPS